MNIPSKNNKVNLTQNCIKSNSDFVKKELNLFCDLALEFLEENKKHGTLNADDIIRNFKPKYWN